MRPEPAGGRIRVARALIAVVLAGAPLAVGSVHPLVVGLEGAAIALATALTYSARDGAPPVPLGPVTWILLAAVLWTVLQLVPLPAGVLQVVSPRSYAINIAGPLLRERRWAPLSLDRAATAGALALQGASLALFVAVRQAWPQNALRSSQGPLRYVALAALGAACAALAHGIVGAKSVFGLYAPIAGRGGLVSLPLVNANHLAGLMSIGATASIGLALDEERRELRWAWLGNAAFCGITTLLTLSRGGTVALILGSAFVIIRARPRSAGVRRVAIALGALACSAGAYLGAEPLAAKLAAMADLSRNLEADRLPLLRDALQMARAYVFTGAGRGTFVLAFPEFSTQSRITTLTHPEFLPLQLACEWGAPFAALFLGVLGAVWFRAAIMRPSSAIRAGALAAVLAICAQNLVDFSLEIGAVAFPAIVCLAIGVTRKAPREGLTPWIPRTVGAGAWVAAGVAVLLAGRFASLHGFESDGRRLRQMVNDGVRARAVVERGRRLVEAHPADAYLPIQVARGLLKSSPRGALTFLNRALWIDPHSTAAHLLTARALLRLGLSGQALLHYRAAAWDSKLAASIAEEVAQLIRDPEKAIRFVPEGEGGLDVLQILTQIYLARSETESALQLARELVRRSGGGAEERVVLGRVLLAAGQPLEAIRIARGTRKTEMECPGASVEADALRQIGRAPEGAALLDRAMRWCPDAPAVREQLLGLAAEAHDWPRAEQALAAYRGVAGDSDAGLARAFFLEGRLEDVRGRRARAAGAFQQAADLAPENAEYQDAARQAWARIGRQDRLELLRQPDRKRR